MLYQTKIIKEQLANIPKKDYSNFLKSKKNLLSYNFFRNLVKREKIILNEATYSREYREQDVYWEGRHGYIISEAGYYDIEATPEISEMLYTERSITFAKYLFKKKGYRFKAYAMKKLLTDNKELYEKLKRLC